MKNQSDKKGKKYVIKDHQLYTARFGVLLNLFRENSISSKKRWLVIKIFFWALLLQPFVWLQKLFYGRAVSRIKIESPIFIIGHWRSGTTHLHYLIAKDPNLGTMTNFINFMFNICLIGKDWLDYILMPLMPEKRPMDNIKMTMHSPQEEEPASGTITSATGVHAVFFPKNRNYFEKFVLFEGTTAAEKSKWGHAYHEIMQTVCYAHKGKRVLMKGPFNTSRVKELLELYPDAKFIYIHRNPYQVYSSTRKLYKTNVESQMLQDMSEQKIRDMIFEFYSRMLNKYISDRMLIPKGNLIEISYDDLSNNAMGTAEKIYQKLFIPGFDEAKPYFEAYLKSVENYEKNNFEEFEPELLERIKKEWAFSFEAWGYDLKNDTVPV